MTLEEEAEKFRDELAEMLNFDWRVRGGEKDKSTRRHLLVAFMYEAYQGQIGMRDIALMCGYRAKQRHVMVQYAVGKIKDLVSIGDKDVLPLYKQLRTVLREFNFEATKEEVPPELKTVRFDLFLKQWQYDLLKKQANKDGDSMSGIIRGLINEKYEYKIESEPITTA